MGLWGTFMESIPAYTGLSPVTFFTLLAVLIGVYHLVSGMFATPEVSPREFVPMEPIPQPVQMGEVTAEELKAYDGSDPKKPLLMSIKGNIYDVTQSRMFYGPGGPYALFAGKECSRALAKMSFEEKDINGDLEGLGPFELDALQDWEYQFMGKYVKVGTLKKTNPKEVEVTEGTSNDGPEAADSESPSKAEEHKENGTEVKEDVVVTKENACDCNGAKTDPMELGEASEDAPDGKKIKEIVHESNHTAEVAQE